MPANGDTFANCLAGIAAYYPPNQGSCAIDSQGRLYFAMIDTSYYTRIFRADSWADGDAWTLMKTFTKATNATDRHTSRIAIDANDVLHVATRDSATSDIWYSQSADGGSTWTVDEEQRAGTFGGVCGIGLDSSGNVYIFTWVSSGQGIGQVQKRTSGGTWSQVGTAPNITNVAHTGPQFTQRGEDSVCYMGFSNANGSAAVQYVEFDLGTEAWTGPTTLATFGGSDYYWGWSVIEDKNGDLHSFGTASRETAYEADNIGGTWGRT